MAARDRQGRLRAVGGRSLLAVAALLVASCSQEGGRPSASGTVPAPQERTDAQLVRDYVAAVADGDIEGAMALRCTAARIEPHDERIFATQVSQLRDTLGPIGVASVTAADPVGLEPSQDGDHPEELLVRFTYGGRTAARSLRLVVVDEDDERRLCGVLTDPPFGPDDMPAPRDLGSTDASPDQMLPAAGPTGWSRVTVDEPELEPGSVAAAWRAWKPTSFGGARVTAVQFESAKAAADEAADWTSELSGDAVATFPVPDVPGAVGIRYVAHAWTWVQAPSEAPLIDVVVLRGGDRAADASVTITDPDEGHDIGLALAAEIAALARFG